MTPNHRKYRLPAAVEPYTDVLLFVVCLLAAHFFWKLTIDADEQGGPVFWFGLNISPPFDLLSEHIARTTYRLLSLTRDTVHYLPPDLIRFDNGHSVRIVWSCTALKQSFIWLVIMLFARGSWKRKLWFIPLGWLAIYVFNILRITLIAMIVEPRPDLFDLMHAYVFKYLFYGMLFLLWVWWVERLADRKGQKV